MEGDATQPVCVPLQRRQLLQQVLCKLSCSLASHAQASFFGQARPCIEQACTSMPNVNGMAVSRMVARGPCYRRYLASPGQQLSKAWLCCLRCRLQGWLPPQEGLGLLQGATPRLPCCAGLIISASTLASHALTPRTCDAGFKSSASVHA